MNFKLLILILGFEFSFFGIKFTDVHISGLTSLQEIVHLLWFLVRDITDIYQTMINITKIILKIYNCRTSAPEMRFRMLVEYRLVVTFRDFWLYTVRGRINCRRR